jgi:hypothetical protein
MPSPRAVASSITHHWEDLPDDQLLSVQHPEGRAISEVTAFVTAIMANIPIFQDGRRR